MKSFDKYLIQVVVVTVCFFDAAVAGTIDALPAGGAFAGVPMFIPVLLLITDILGFTRVHSFTRPARK